MSRANQPHTSKSILRNVAFGSLTWFLPLGLSFVATPVIVRSLGNSDYGIYALVLGFIGYSFTFSLGRAITKYIAEYRNTGESEKITNVIGISMVLNFVIGTIGVVVLCSLAPFLVRVVFSIDAAAQEKTITAMYLASAIIFVSMFSQIFNSMLQGIHRFDVYSKVYTTNSFFLIGGNLVLAFLGYGLLHLLAWNLAVLVIFAFVYAVIAKRLVPEFKFRFRFEKETVGLVLRYSSGVIAYQILANFLLLFERGWITHQLGTENLTYYVVPMSLGIYLHGFVSSLVLVIFPLASELKDDRERLLKLYTKATKIIAMIVVFVMVSVLVNSRLFLHLWMGESFADNSSTLLILHVLAFGLTAIVSVSWQMTEGLGYPRYNVAIFSVCLVISIVLMILLTPAWGNIGVAIARLAGFGTTFFSIFLVERIFFRHVQTRFWSRLLGSLVLASVATAFVEYVISSSMGANWPIFLFSIFAGTAVFGFVLWLLGFVTADEKLLLKGIIRR